MGNTKRILVVDDEETLTFSLYQNFIMAEFEGEVMTASSGEDAWGKFQEKPFDVVLTDIAMKEMSGIELLQKIKIQQPETKVIIMTAFAQTYKKGEAQDNGADFYLEKPFDNKVVRQVVMSFLED